MDVSAGSGAAGCLQLRAASPRGERRARDEGGLYRRCGRADLRRRSTSARAASPRRLRDAGVKREERVLILMQDCTDWPVAFLGAMLAGVVPVAVNTLLTADDLAYMLEHSRAQARLRQRRAASRR